MKELNVKKKKKTKSVKLIVLSPWKDTGHGSSEYESMVLG